jgi:Arc/MetJ family transcription regulator
VRLSSACGFRGALSWNPKTARIDGMKTTLDIPEDELREAIRHTGAKTKREAVVIALAEFNRRRRLQKLAEQFGTLDGFMTQEELRRMREDP